METWPPRTATSKEKIPQRKDLVCVGGTDATNWETVGCIWSERGRENSEGKDQTNGMRHQPWCLVIQGDITQMVTACGDGCERTGC